jgi:hypothetical protein
VYAHVQERVHPNAVNAFVVTQSGDMATASLLPSKFVSPDSGYHLLPFNATLGFFGGCRGVSGTMTSSNFSCPTAVIVNETAFVSDVYIIDSCSSDSTRTDTNNEGKDGRSNCHILEDVGSSSSN